MPRTIKSRATVGPKAVVTRKRWKVSRGSLVTAQLLELGVDHPSWRTKAEDHDGGKITCPGAIVKLVPPAGTPEALVLAIERTYYAGGARSVKVMPTPEEVRVTVEGVEFDFETAEDNRTLRQVALERVDRTTNSVDQPALKKLVEQAMDAAEAS